MAGWNSHTGQAIALPLESVDTDQLIPARFMSVPRAQGYGDYLLHDMRRDGDGALLADFPLNRHPGASVLIARRNFGSGSSREAAVYALVDYGIRAVLAPSFGDIFAANAVNNGLLPARLSPEQIETLIDALGAATADAQIDLEGRAITIGTHRFAFDLEDVPLQKLINGWDDIDLTAAHGEQIETFRRARRQQFPWAWPAMQT